jgi:hypothetical protein
VEVRSVELYSPDSETDAAGIADYMSRKQNQADDMVVRMRGNSADKARDVLDNSRDQRFGSRRIVDNSGRNRFDMERGRNEPGHYEDPDSGDGGDGSCLASSGGAEGELASGGCDDNGNYIPLLPGGDLPIPGDPLPVPELPGLVFA